MAAKKKASTRETNGKPSKTDFVLSLPAETPTEEVIAKAKDAGISLTDTYVYKIRSRHKAKSRSVAPKGAKKAKKAAPKPRAQSSSRASGPPSSISAIEARFIEMAL